MAGLLDDTPEKQSCRCECCRKLMFEMRYHMISENEWAEVTIVCPRCKRRQIIRFCYDPLVKEE